MSTTENNPVDKGKFAKWFSRLPKPLKITVAVIVAATVALWLLFPVSCSTVRVVGNTGNSDVGVSQSADSTHVSISFRRL